MEENGSMLNSVRTTVDIPALVYRKLKEQAARQGCSVRELVTRGIDQVLLKDRDSGGARVEFPLIRSKGPKVEITNRRTYELIEFP